MTKKDTSRHQVVPAYIHITKIEEHQKYKEFLLYLITEAPGDTYETVTRTDWNIDGELPRRYLRVFYEEILDGKNKYLEKQQKFYQAEFFQITHGWYQQYEDNSEHLWHRHGSANFTNVYFLELPDKENRTEIKDVEYDAEEGYLITFPAQLLHRSKPSKGRKTIISFNSNFI